MQKHSKFKRMRGCNFSFIVNGSFIKWVAATEIANQLNTFQIPVKYIAYTQFLAASARLKKIPIHWGMDGGSYFCEIKKHYTLKKKTVPCD